MAQEAVGDDGWWCFQFEIKMDRCSVADKQGDEDGRVDECSLECLGVDEVVETSVEVVTGDGVAASREEISGDEGRRGELEWI